MIRMAYYGCANRPFFHIVATRKTSPRNGRILEQIGTYDPMTNTSGEKLVAINFERLKYWYAVRGAHVSKPVTELLGRYSKTSRIRTLIFEIIANPKNKFGTQRV